MGPFLEPSIDSRSHSVREEGVKKRLERGQRARMRGLGVGFYLINQEAVNAFCEGTKHT